jgi:hypothetical protein
LHGAAVNTKHHLGWVFVARAVANFVSGHFFYRKNHVLQVSGAVRVRFVLFLCKLPSSMASGFTLNLGTGPGLVGSGLAGSGLAGSGLFLTCFK